MTSQKLSILNISYKNDESVRILTAVLSKWFSNPKTLYFTSPNLKYPFNINHWISTFYKEDNIETYILKNENWIIGHLSVKIDENKNTVIVFVGNRPQFYELKNRFVSIFSTAAFVWP